MNLVTDTPYEGHRRRLKKLETIEASRLGSTLTAARGRVARALRLTPHQLRDIRRGKLKDLYGEAKDRIDRAFLAAARREIAALHHDVALALAADRPIDPGAIAEAQASIDALEELIREAKARSGTREERQC